MLLAAAVVLVMVVIAYWYWFTKDTVKLVVTGANAISNLGATVVGNLAVSYTTSSKSDPTTWVGKKVKLHTKSLGKINATILAADAAGFIILANPTPTAAYAADSGDYARVVLKY